MPKKISSIQLWQADRSAQVTLPSGNTFINSCDKAPFVTKRLGRPWSMKMELMASSTLATASSSDSYYLGVRKIIRFVYDDSSIEEWRIKKRDRQTSGNKNFVLDCEPIWQDLQYTGVRHTLSTGEVRFNVNFFGMTVDDILTDLFSSSYNCPALFTKGTVDSTIGAKEIRVSLNGQNFMQALKVISEAAQCEWGVSYDAVNDDYEFDFYEIGDYGGGQAEAVDRLIQMGDGMGNRRNLLVRNDGQQLFSRLVPIAGQGNQTTGIGNITFTATAVTSGSPQVLALDKELIIFDDLPLMDGETVYFGNATDGWNEITSTDSANNRITITGTIGGIADTREGRFGVGTGKDKLVTLEDSSAVSSLGVVESVYRRTDINPFTNLIKEAGRTDDFSEWSSGMPVGTTKIGTPTVAEETGEQYVTYGAKSAKVSADSGEGIQTTLTIDNSGYPYFSLLVYLQVESGSVKVEFEDSNGDLIPEGQFAQTNSSTTQGLSLAAGQPASGTATIRVVALENSTVFYLDAWVLTNSQNVQPFSPLMGELDLWTQAARELQTNGGIQPDQYTGDFWDDAYDNGSAQEVTIGSWVTVKDGWNGSSFDINFEGRVLELSYEETYLGRHYKRNVKISNRPTELNQFLNSTYVTQESTQTQPNVPLAESLSALELAIKEGNLIFGRDGIIQPSGDGGVLIDTSNQYIKIDVSGIDYRYRAVQTNTSPPFNKETYYTQILINSNAVTFKAVVESGETDNIKTASYASFGSLIANKNGSLSKVAPLNVSAMLIKFGDKYLRLSDTDLRTYDGTTLVDTLSTF